MKKIITGARKNPLLLASIISTTAFAIFLQTNNAEKSVLGDVGQASDDVTLEQSNNPFKVKNLDAERLERVAVDSHDDIVEESVTIFSDNEIASFDEKLINKTSSEDRIKRLKEKLPDAELTNQIVDDEGALISEYSLKSTITEQNRVAYEQARDDEKQRIDSYVEDAMREGIIVSIDELDVVSAEIPDMMSLYLVQSKSDKLLDTKFQIAENANDDGFAMRVESGYVNLTDTDDAEAYKGTFDAVGLAGQKNVRRKGGGGRTLAFNPKYASHGDHFITTRWEKFQSKTNGRNWFYNRWGTFNPANKRYYGKAYMIEATMRSRPWKSASDRVTKGPINWIPASKENCGAGGSSSISYGGASLSIPINNCVRAEPLVNVNPGKHRFGLKWTGRTLSTSDLDFAFSFQAKNSTVNPIMADYVWMEVQYCSNPGGFPTACRGGPKNKVLWKDSGW